MLAEKTSDILKMGMKLREQRGNWLSHWDELAQYFLPSREGFLGEQADGEEHGHRNYTDSPQLARRSLSTAISYQQRPAGKRWFKAVPKNFKLMSDESVKLWLDAVTHITYNAVYDPRCKMEKNLAEADADLVTFGTAVVRMGWDAANRHLTYKTQHLRNTVLGVDHAGQVDMAWTFTKQPLRNIIQQFGEDKLTTKMKDAQTAGNKLDEMFEICHACIPNEDFKLKGFGKKRMPYASLWFSVDEKELIDQGGYWDFPYLCPRWDTSTGEVYGRSPAMVALDSARLANEISRDLSEAGANVVRPPLGAWADMIRGDVQLHSGGLTLFEAQGGFEGSGPPIWPVSTGAMPREIMEFLQIVEERISAAFFRDILELPSARDANMTATEISARLDQYARQAAPVFARVETDYSAAHINRAFNVLMREGMYPPAPEALHDAEIEFEYESPLKQLRDKAEAVKIMEGLGMVQQIAAQMPPEKAAEMADNFDPDAIARMVAALSDLPQAILTPFEKMQAEREARAQQMQQMQMAEMAQKMGPALSGGVQALTKAKEGGMLGMDEPLPIAATGVSDAAEEVGEELAGEFEEVA